jgi:hypothetical protein
VVKELTDTRARAAVDLESRAHAAAKRASAMVIAARERAVEAHATADAAEARRLAAESEARAVSARAETVVQQAQAEARRVVGAARQEATQVAQRARRVGSWFGAIWHGLLGASPAAAARKAAGEARAKERMLAQGRVAAAEAWADRLRNRLHATEDKLATVAGSMATVGAERDRLARELARLRPPLTPPPPPAALAVRLPR